MVMMRTICLVAALGVAAVEVAAQKQPNFIVLQPDDLRFFEEWTPPPHFPRRGQVESFPRSGLPNIEELRSNGVQMTEAYTVSPMCGTSRYSTITGRYPSRSSFNRASNSGRPTSDIRIPTTKLQDVTSVVDGNDCSENNLAALMKRNGYRTGVVGKWHLTRTNGSFSYTGLQNQIRSCGFDFAESIYAENMNGQWHDGTFNHNMEYMTEQGIEFITADPSTPFFLYFNPTVPHGSGNVLEALTDFPCTRSPAGTVPEPVVKGMTEGSNCADYRATVIERAQGDTANNGLGSVWLDDGIGALLQTLRDMDQLDNTFFLFQMDHGQEGKSMLWEPGVRLAQFVHYPDKISPSQFHGMVQTVDIAATILDYAGINENSPGYYEMDGKSWKPALEDSSIASTWDDDRCLWFEMDQDRAVRCGCHKYMRLVPGSTTYSRGNQRHQLDVDSVVLYNLCDDDGETYETGENREASDIKDSEADLLGKMSADADCFLSSTQANQDPDYSGCGPVPAPAPTPSPTPEPPAFCFSGDNSVEVYGKGDTKMKDLRLGDKVLVSERDFEVVYSFGHRDDSISADFLRFEPSKLEISTSHMLLVQGKGMTPASTIQIGDMLSDGEAVTSVQTVSRKGVYAPFTASGKVQVNGVVASNYVAFQESDVLHIGQWKSSLTFQFLAHSFEAPHRLVCRFIMDCSSESYTHSGVSAWVNGPLQFSHWLFEQNPMVMGLFLLPISATLLVFVFVEGVLCSPVPSLCLALSMLLLSQGSTGKTK